MTKLNEYFDNELSAQEQLEVQMWLAEHGENPDPETQLAELFDGLHVDDDTAARAAFGRVAHRLGIAGGQKPAASHRARIVTWSQRIAAVLVIPLLCAVWLLYADRQPGVEWLEQQVPCGETAELALPDGTLLHLNSGSHITYPSAFTGKERRIFVEGEIFADVAKNPRKPFIIQSGEVGIRVLGTKFNFKSYANTDCVEVLLVEGSVQFDINTKARKQQLVMKPGDMVQYDRASGDIDLTSFRPGYFKSFAENRAIHFFNLRMRDIAADLERLFGTQIVILDETLAQARYFAYFTNNENLDQILSAINSNHKMQVLRRDGVIYLSSN